MLLWLFATFSFLFWPVSSIAGSTEDDYTKGIEMYNQGDLVGGFKLLKKVAEAGYAPAQARFGYILDYSEYNEDAVDMYRKAAKQGNADGAFGLAEMYSKGEGVGKDEEQAMYWFETAAEMGHLRAMQTLAKIFEKGSLGMSVDLELSKSWGKKADALLKTIKPKTPAKKK